MFFSLKKGVLYRCTRNYGFIANLNNGQQFTLDAIGADFLKELSEQPRSLDEIINNLLVDYDVSREEITQDFLSVAADLHEEGYISISTTPCGNEQGEIIQPPKVNIPTITDLTIEITNKCNERCVHCYLADAKKDKGVAMDFNIVKRLIDEFAQIGGRKITFTGGEAFMHKNLMNSIEYASLKDLEIAVYSNLISVTPSQIKKLKEYNIVEIQVSLYGVIPELHDAVTRVKGSCNRTMTSIEQMVKAGLPIKLVCPVMRENKDGVWQVIDYAKNLNVAIELEMYINSREDQSDDNLQHRLSIEEMKVFMSDLMDYDEKLGMEILLRHKHEYNQSYNLVEELSMPLCQAGYYGLYVTATGSIAICPNLQGYELGDIKTDNLHDIWTQNQRLMQIRTLRECDFKECIQCEARDYCIRCYAHNYAEAKNIMIMPKYACEMAFAAKEVVENRITDV